MNDDAGSDVVGSDVAGKLEPAAGNTAANSAEAPTALDFEQDLAAAVASFRLGMTHARFRGRVGQRRGMGPGSSTEFHDFRDYAPGDDLRHVDWTSYARTDQLRVRLHEAEVAPVVEVLIDTSPSMAVTEAKKRTLLGLARALQEWARREGAVGRVIALGAGELRAEALLTDGSLSFDGASQPQPPRVPLRSGSVRVVVTDALWHEDAGAVLSRMAAGASRFACLHLLDPWEREPTEQPASTFVDVETGAHKSLRLDASALSVYTERLGRLCSSLHERVVGLGGDCVAVTAGNLQTVCQRDLVPARIVEPA